MTAEGDPFSPGIVDAPGAPDDAVQPNRPLSDLLREHVFAMHEVEMTLPPEQRTNLDPSMFTTEAQASAYIAEVMARLRPGIMRAR